jgi:phage terminase large subunit-like protein
VVTRGSTFDNAANLAPAFLEKVKAKYEGTRLGRQELYAELLDDTPGALWNWVMLTPIQVPVAPALRRIVVAVDPAVTSNANSDQTGLVVVGISGPQVGFPDGLLYVLEDASGIYTPLQWAEHAVRLFKKYNADKVIAEVNNGGDLVEVNIRQVDRSVPYKAVHASKGKYTRAEPVSALYEQARVRHLPGLNDLETQMTTWSAGTGEKSPDRIDALVWGITELALAPAGAPVQVF